MTQTTQQRVPVLLGTKNGAFLIESDAQRQHWQVQRPFFEDWRISHAVPDRAIPLASIGAWPASGLAQPSSWQGPGRHLGAPPAGA